MTEGVSVVAACHKMKTPIVSRSAWHRRRKPFGAAWSFVIPHRALEAPFRSLIAPKLAWNEANTAGTTWSFSERYVVYNKRVTGARPPGKLSKQYDSTSPLNLRGPSSDMETQEHGLESQDVGVFGTVN